MQDPPNEQDGRKVLQTELDKMKLSPSDMWISADEVQIEMWDEWAAEIGIPRSKFVRMAANAGIKSMDLPAHGQSYDDSSTSFRTEIFDAVEGGASDADEVVEMVCDAIRDQIRDEVNDLLTTGQLDYDARQGLHRTNGGTE